MDKINVPFVDIKGHWAEKYIENAFFAGYLKGRTESTFEPEGNVKRGELAKVLSDLITNDDEKTQMVDSDVVNNVVAALLTKFRKEK